MRINGRIKNQLVRLLVGLIITGNLFEQIMFKIWGCGTSTVGGINVNVINAFISHGAQGIKEASDQPIIYTLLSVGF